MATHQGNIRMAVQPLAEMFEEPAEGADRKRLLAMVMFVTVVATVSLAVYLFLRPPNRHLDPTPYDGIVSQLRSSMSQEDVMQLLRTASDGVQRGLIAEYDESTDSGSHHVLTYSIGGEEPLKVRFGGTSGHGLADWCFRDHCHDNVE